MAPCNTPPCNAVYDGCYYYYLPWGQDKPCVCVECSWEDIAFRLEPMNIINRMAENLVRDGCFLLRIIYMFDLSLKEMVTNALYPFFNSFVMLP